MLFFTQKKKKLNQRKSQKHPYFPYFPYYPRIFRFGLDTGGFLPPFFLKPISVIAKVIRFLSKPDIKKSFPLKLNFAPVGIAFNFVRVAVVNL